MSDGLVKRSGDEVRLTAQVWAEHLARWRRSGWSMARYSREHGLPVHQLRYRVQLDSDREQGGFVQVTSPEGSAGDLTLEWGARARIRIPRGFDPVTLARVLELTL